MTLPDSERVTLELILDAERAEKTLRQMVLEAEELSAVIQEFAATSGASFKQASAYIQKYMKDVHNVTIPAKQISEALKLATLETKNLHKSSLQLLKTEQQLALEAERLAAAASKPAQVLGKAFTPQQFAPVLQQFQQLSKLDFSNITNYAQNIKSLMGGIRNISQLTGASIQDVGKHIQQNFQNVPKVALQDAMKNLNTEIKGADNTAQKFTRTLDLVRIAMGALVAMVVFRAIQFFEESMRKAIEAAEDFETSLYRLANVERILSETGIDIVFDDLNDAIGRIKKQLPIFSETDITKQISLIGIMTKDLGLSAQEIEQLSLAIGVLNIRSAATEDLMTTTNKVLQAIVSKGVGVGQLGIKFSEAAVTAKAVELGYIKVGESLSDLEDEQRDFVVGQAKVAIAIANVSGEVETLNEYMDLNTAKIQEGESAWEDFLKASGQAILPFKASIGQVVSFLGPIFVARIVETKMQVVELFAAIDAAIVTTVKLLRGDGIKAIREFGYEFEKYKDIFSEKFFPAEAYEGMDTPTIPLDNLKKGLEEISELEGFDDLVDDLGKLQDKLEDLNETFDIKQTRKWEDYQIDIQRIQEDYAIKRQKLIEDTNDKIEDANQKHQKRQKDDEAKFQEQMRQLREKFLFNLEDALRERDARQVLRLQRQYQMDKTALQNEHALRQKQQDEQHQEDLQRIRDDRDERLRELAEEERLRLQREREDYELKKQREEEDHARDLEDLKEKIDDRLMEFARALGEELDLNEEGVNAIYDLLQQYYGPDGLFEELYDYSYDSMVESAQQMLSAINQIVGQAKYALASVSMFPQFNPGAISSAQFTGANLGGQAKGGTYLATRPTTATFGEAGPEIAQFIPLSKLKSGNGAGSVGGGSMGGLVEIDLLLSPDLEARITRNTLGETAKVITKVRRTK